MKGLFATLSLATLPLLVSRFLMLRRMSLCRVSWRHCRWHFQNDTLAKKIRLEHFEMSVYIHKKCHLSVMFRIFYEQHII
jgi:hypothetical protein